LMLMVGALSAGSLAQGSSSPGLDDGAPSERR
jgi:hypothetical protein